MKAYTDLEQSKKLAKILPVESADMSWVSNGLGKPFARTIPIKGHPEELCACWSLAALLSILPNNEHITTSVSRGTWEIESINYLPNTWWCEYEDSKSLTEFNVSADNPVDACVAVIERLHEKNIL